MKRVMLSILVSWFTTGCAREAAPPAAPAVPAPPVSAPPAAPAPPTAHAAVVEQLPGVWVGTADTPFGEMPFAIEFVRKPDGSVHGRAEQGPRMYLDFHFRNEGGTWVLHEAGELPGAGVQRHVLAPAAGGGARWTTADASYLAVTIGIDGDAMAFDATVHALAVVAGTFLAGAALEALWGYPAAEVRSRLWGSVTVVSVIVIAVQATVDEMKARALRSEGRAARARVAVLRAELAALQARTDPHFLFNSLNTVASLIPDDPALAERTLERLADVFRYALDAGRRATVTLADELRAVEAYLDVEATRLGDRLRWRIDADADVGTIDLPPLALQPLAENAVLHGAQRRRGATMITVSARRTGDSVELAVEDRPDGAEDGASPGASAGSGTALADLRTRLALAYGDAARVEAGPLAPAGWRAVITLFAPHVPTSRAVS